MAVFRKFEYLCNSALGPWAEFEFKSAIIILSSIIVQFSNLIMAKILKAQ